MQLNSSHMFIFSTLDTLLSTGNHSNHAQMLRQGYEIGLGVGDYSSAFWCGIHYIQKALVAGTKLSVLKKEVEYQTRLIEKHSQSMIKAYIKLFQYTINTLIGNGESAQRNEEEEGIKTDFAECILFHEVVRSFWKGHYERCNFYAEKYSNSFTEIKNIRSFIILFYQGIVLSRFHKNRKNELRKQVAKNALESIRRASHESKWNYSNKVHLLEAEYFSLRWKNDEAKIAYDAAIAASRSSKFIHEQGLACELAGFHYTRIEKYDTAREFFNQAKTCYNEWGSQMKVKHVTDQIVLLKDK